MKVAVFIKLEEKDQNVYIWYHMVSCEFNKGKDHCCNASKLHGIDYEPFDFIGRGLQNIATCLFPRESEEISWVVSCGLKGNLSVSFHCCPHVSLCMPLTTKGISEHDPYEKIQPCK